MFAPTSLLISIVAGQQLARPILREHLVVGNGSRLGFALMAPATAPRRGRGQRIDLDPAAVTWLRQTRGISLRGLAKLVEISPGYLHDIESGRRGPTDAVLDRITTALGCPRAVLMRKRGEGT